MRFWVILSAAYLVGSSFFLIDGLNSLFTQQSEYNKYRGSDFIYPADYKECKGIENKDYKIIGVPVLNFDYNRQEEFVKSGLKIDLKDYEIAICFYNYETLRKFYNQYSEYGQGNPSLIYKTYADQKIKPRTKPVWVESLFFGFAVSLLPPLVILIIGSLIYWGFAGFKAETMPK